MGGAVFLGEVKGETMSFLVKIARYIGLSVIAIIFLAVPSLFTLAIVFDWGFFLGWLLGALLGIEIPIAIFILENLSEE